MNRKWRAADVRDIWGDGERFVHVARHLYCPDERWRHVVPGLGDARARAWDIGCAPAILDALHPDCDRASLECRAHVLKDHDEVLAPVYREELRSAEIAGRSGAHMEKRRCWAFVGDGGVFVGVREVGPRRLPEVKTAYRVVPRRTKGRTPEDFFKAAVTKLRDKSSWKGGGS